MEAIQSMKSREEAWKQMSEDEKMKFIVDWVKVIAKYDHGIGASIGRQLLSSYMAITR